MAEKKKTPDIRFEGFSEAWVKQALGEVVDFLDEKRKPLKAGARNSGQYPYYGASGIIDYVEEYLFDEQLILLSEDGANIIDRNYRVCFLASGKYWVNNHAHVLKSKKNYIDEFICESLERLDFEKYNTGTAQPKLNQEVCRNINIFIPQTAEQTLIGSFFSTLDNLIALQQRKYDKTVNMKKACLEKMFPKKGAKVPDVRFAGFSGEWEQRELGEVLNEKISNGIMNKPGWNELGIKHINVVNLYQNNHIQVEDLEYINVSEKELKRCNVQVGDIFLTRSSLKAEGIAQASILLCKGNYVFDDHIMRLKLQSGFEPFFIKELLNHPTLKEQFITKAKTSTMTTIGQDEISSSVISFPVFLEQAQIGEYFRQLDNLIDLYGQELEKLKNIKKACLEKMFV